MATAVCARHYPKQSGVAAGRSRTAGATYNGTASWYWLRSTRANTVGDVNLTAAVSETGTWRCYGPWNRAGGVRPALPKQIGIAAGISRTVRRPITAPPLGGYVHHGSVSIMLVLLVSVVISHTRSFSTQAAVCARLYRSRQTLRQAETET